MIRSLFATTSRTGLLIRVCSLLALIALALLANLSAYAAQAAHVSNVIPSAQQIPAATAEAKYTVRYVSANAEVLSMSARTAIAYALNAWPTAPPPNNTFYLIDVRWEKTWALATLTSADLNRARDKDEESLLSSGSLINLLLVQTGLGWEAAIDVDDHVHNLLHFIAPTELNETSRRVLFPPIENIRPNRPIPKQQYNGYKFMWPAGSAWRVTQGWHDPYTWGGLFPPNTSLDFDILGGAHSNSDILAASAGTVTYMCNGTIQKLVVVTTDGTSERLGYLHLDRTTVEQEGILVGVHVNQGRKLGRMLDSDSGSLSDSCGTSNGTHIHIYFPEKPFTIDGVTFTDSNVHLGENLYSSQGGAPPTNTPSSPPPSPPNPVSPNDFSVFNETAPTLCWQNVSGASQYYAEVYGSAVNAQSGWQSGTCWTPSSLNGQYNGYQWHVKARNSQQQESSYGTTWHFNIVRSPSPTYTSPPTSIPTPTATTTPGCAPLRFTVGGDPPKEVGAFHAPNQHALAVSTAPTTHNEMIKAPARPADAVTFALDDGSRESALRWGSSSAQIAMIWLNRFTPSSGAFPITLQSIQIAWPTQTDSTTLVGKTVRLVVYSDRDGDGNPDNAMLINQQLVTVHTLVGFEGYPVNITVPGPSGDLYIGFEEYWVEANPSPKIYAAAMDTSPPDRGRSWVGGMDIGVAPNLNNLGANTTRGFIDNPAMGIAANWMIRSTGQSASTTCQLTATPPPGATATSTPSGGTCAAMADYRISQSAGQRGIVGTTDIGNHCDDCVTTVQLPFPYTLYGQTVSQVNVSSNGVLELGTAPDFDNSCATRSSLNTAILAAWTDLDTRNTTNTGDGIFTVVSGSAPHRIFGIEWRAHLYNGGPVNFEILLYEGQNAFNLVYGTMTGNGSTATVGVQNADGSHRTQFECHTGGLSSGTKLVFTTSFTDIGGDVFQPFIENLYCRGIVEGYDDGTFQTATLANRRMLARWIVRARGWAMDTTGGPHFTDVPPSDANYPSIETAYNHGVISGYDDHTFRPTNNLTRGQMSKMIVIAMGWPIVTSGGPHFTDVGTSNVFYGQIETIVNHGLVSGYDCGSNATEPCDSANRRYFRYGNSLSRGQLSKVLSLAISP